MTPTEGLPEVLVSMFVSDNKQLPDCNSPGDRKITLTGSQCVMRIGRASRSASKGLVPEIENSWFDSPVMSRIHAELVADLAAKTVSIRDMGSLHGTYLNWDKSRLCSSQLRELRDGDRIRFGVAVVNGSIHVDPVIVRIGIAFRHQPPSYPLILDYSLCIMGTGEGGEGQASLNRPIGAAPVVPTSQMSTRASPVPACSKTEPTQEGQPKSPHHTPIFIDLLDDDDENDDDNDCVLDDLDCDYDDDDEPTDYCFESSDSEDSTDLQGPVAGGTSDSDKKCSESGSEDSLGPVSVNIGGRAEDASRATAIKPDGMRQGSHDDLQGTTELPSLKFCQTDINSCASEFGSVEDEGESATSDRVAWASFQETDTRPCPAVIHRATAFQPPHLGQTRPIFNLQDRGIGGHLDNTLLITPAPTILQPAGYVAGKPSPLPARGPAVLPTSQLFGRFDDPLGTLQQRTLEDVGQVLRSQMESMSKALHPPESKTFAVDTFNSRGQMPLDGTLEHQAQLPSEGSICPQHLIKRKQDDASETIPVNSDPGLRLDAQSRRTHVGIFDLINTSGRDSSKAEDVTKCQDGSGHTRKRKIDEISGISKQEGDSEASQNKQQASGADSVNVTATVGGHEEVDRTPKRQRTDTGLFQRIAERIGYAALGGATVGAVVFGSLVYTAPALA